MQSNEQAQNGFHRLAPSRRLLQQTAQLSLHVGKRALQRGIVDDVGQLIEIALQVIQFICAFQVTIVNVLPTLGSHRLIAEISDARKDVVRKMLDEKARSRLPRL